MPHQQYWNCYQRKRTFNGVMPCQHSEADLELKDLNLIHLLRYHVNEIDRENLKYNDHTLKYRYSQEDNLKRTGWTWIHNEQWSHHNSKVVLIEREVLNLSGEMQGLFVNENWRKGEQHQSRQLLDEGHTSYHHLSMV